MNQTFLPGNRPYHHEGSAGDGLGDEAGRPKKVSTKAPFLLILLFALGAVVGVAHHAFYASIDGRSADNQAWILRAGTAIAYLAKLLFAASIGTAFTQQLWRSMRSEAFSLGAIDGLFDLKNNPERLFSKEIFIKAQLVMLLVAVIWALPLLPIIAPGSISVRATSSSHSGVEIPIKTLNFSRSLETPLLGSSNYTVSLAEINGVGATSDGYYKPSSRANGLVYSTVYGGEILSADSPCGANCTFTQAFIGPAYQCLDIDFAHDGELGSPFCHGTPATSPDGACDDFLTPTDNPFDITWYLARNSSGDTCEGCPGEAWMDGKLWVEYQYLLPQYRVQTGDSATNGTPIPASAFEKHQFVCQSYNAIYTIQRTYVNFQQTNQGKQEFLTPLNYSAEAFGLKGGLISPSYAGYAIHQLLYSILSGTIGINGRFQPIDTTGLGGTQLVEPQPFPHPNYSLSPHPSNPGSSGIQKPIRDLRAAIEQLHFNVTVGMLTIPNLIYLQDDTASASTTSFQNLWTYNKIPLFAVYGGFAAANLLAVVVGIVAVLDNGGRGISRSGFLRVLMTTRNQTLDRVVGGRGRGDDNMQVEVERTKVRYGELTGTGRVGFGVEGEVTSLRRRGG